MGTLELTPAPLVRDPFRAWIDEVKAKRTWIGLEERYGKPAPA